MAFKIDGIYMEQKEKIGLKISKVCTSKVFSNVIVILGAVALVCSLGKNILNMCTVWELGDEAGYLSNTAYFVGADWDVIRANISYFAYGYSLFLIPAFLLSNSGVELVQGAMWFNVICVLGVYYILIFLLQKIIKLENRVLAAIIAFITCQSAYLYCNALKVNCETLLTFEYCLVALLIYRSIEYKKRHQFIFLGIISAFMYATHTRMFVPIIVMFASVIITLCFYKKQQSTRTITLLLMELTVSFSLAFLLFFLIKKSIVSSATALASEIGEEDLTTGNLISKEYILQRISWLFIPENIKMYFWSFCVKLYYIIVASAGTIFFGYISIVKGILHGKREEGHAYFAVKLFFLLGISAMIIVCTLNGAGMLENFCYFFYSRYYEYTLIPLMSFGMATVITQKWKSKIYAIFILISIVIGILTANLGNYLYSEEIHKDTARIPAFSWIIDKTSNYKEMIMFGTVIICLLLVLYCLVSKFEIKRVVILILAACMIWNSTSMGVQIIDDIHKEAKADTQIAEFIQDNPGDTVYMIDDESYKHSKYYSRMQVVLKDIPLRVITSEELEQIDDIEEGAFILTYCTTTLGDSYLKDFDYVMKGAVFELWKK